MVVDPRILKLDCEAERIQNFFYPQICAGTQKERVVEPTFNMAYIVVAHFITGAEFEADIEPGNILECLDTDRAQSAYVSGWIRLRVSSVAVSAPVIAGVFACFRLRGKWSSRFIRCSRYNRYTR